MDPKVGTNVWPSVVLTGISVLMGFCPTITHHTMTWASKVDSYVLSMMTLILNKFLNMR